MVLCTRIYTFVSYRILNMKRKDTKLKHSVVALVVSPFFSILEVQGSNLACSLSYALKIFLCLGVYLHYMCICFILCLRFSFSSYCDHHPFHIAPSRFRPFHTIFMPLPKIFTTFTPTKPHVLRYVPRKESEISANGINRLLALL